MLRNPFNKSDYKFADLKNTACIVCCHVLQNTAPILYVTHDEEDGMWQFLCGNKNHDSDQAKIISLGEVTSIDSSINELHEMPVGVGAERESRSSQWRLFKL